MTKSLIKTLKEVFGIGLLMSGLAVTILGGILGTSIPQAAAGILLVGLSFVFVTPKRLAELVIEGIFGINP